MHDVVSLINISQSRKLKEVSYYRLTAEFVEALYSGHGDRKYENLRVTGASLGGGLAILMGAITGAAAVSISGLNTMYSRRTFLPSITKHQLDTRVFNAIPERDIIAHIDKLIVCIVLCSVVWCGVHRLPSHFLLADHLSRCGGNSRVFFAMFVSFLQPGMNYQRMQCTAPKNSLFGCHSMFRASARSSTSAEIRGLRSIAGA
mmetsp:Transcript_34608/g.81591  ORF Transcript_34608/g.81591 Transcript_34608/m.81591 type:complete len:203 (+) Transcript_34608:627-1235(+)